MEGTNYINELLSGRTVIGSKEQIGDNLFLIPIYKIKLSFFNLKSDVKNTNNDGSSGTINITPICLLKVDNEKIDMIHLQDDNKKDGLVELIPNVLANIDLSSLLKGVNI